MKYIFIKLSLIITLIVMLGGCGNNNTKPLNGQYKINVRLEGGSGRAGVESPAILKSENGKTLITLVWSSPYYDYMLVEGEKYLPVNSQGNSVFEIPLDMERDSLSFIADTTAMETPHEIEYTLYYNLPEDNGNMALDDDTEDIENINDTPSDKTSDSSSLTQGIDFNALIKTGELKPEYAKQFFVEYYNDVYPLITIVDDKRYLIIPENKETVINTPKDVTVLERPLKETYLVSTAAMDLIRQANAMDNIMFSGTKEKDWYIEEAREAMEKGGLKYAGKYSAPDYELLVSNNCSLAIENTMIFHSPKVKEQLERLGIPVMVERSAYEEDPIGRMEWIKLYGIIYDTYDVALDFFENQKKLISPLLNEKESTGKSIAFFSINSNGSVNVRKGEDYIVKMIRMAGGDYIFSDLSDGTNSLSTMSIQMESFYERAAEADILIYNSTLAVEIESLEELMEKEGLLENFKAVKNKNVYCTRKSMFQHTTAIGEIILDMHAIFTGDRERELKYIYRLS